MSTDNPSIHEANKVVRVLTGKQLKFTIRIHKADGTVVELQSNGVPKLDWNTEARALWINCGDYPSTSPIMPHELGMIILAEENPKP